MQAVFGELALGDVLARADESDRPFLLVKKHVPMLFHELDPAIRLPIADLGGYRACGFGCHERVGIQYDQGAA
jgi:hypothetical protein